MEKFNDVIQESNGDVVSTATVTIYNSVGGAIAEIFDDDETIQLNNPFTLSDLNYNTDGTFWFKAANGDYNIKVVNGAKTKWKYDVTLFDFEEATAPNDFTKTVDPTVNDDSSAGWEIGSVWGNTSTQETYRATEVTVGAAVWIQTTLTLDELGTMATQDANVVAITGGDVTGIGTLGVTGNATIGGNISVNGTVDGRDVAADGTKLDTVESNADVTDAVNVEAAGAVMEGDISTANMQFVIDEDSMVSDSATKVPTQQSVKAYVASELVGAVTYQGGYDAATNTPNLDSSPTGIEIGMMYACTVAGTFFTVGLEVGDVVIAEINNPTVEADWTIVSKDLNDASIKVAYENNADTNAYTDSEKTLVGTITSKAPLASPALTGDPTAPTQVPANNSTRLATTAYVEAAVAAASSASGFPAGTRMVFQQNSAPTGWTKETAAAYDNATFKSYTGTLTNTGGAGLFSSTLSGTVATSGGAVNNTSLSEAQMPLHNHSITLGQSDSSSCAVNAGSAKWAGGNCTPSSSYAGTSNNKGSGNSHAHGFTNPTFNMNVKYIGVITAQKD